MRNNRRSIRLKKYDYSQTGAYFVTICTQRRQCLFGEVTDGQMRLNEYGEMVKREWVKTPEIRCEIEMDKFVVMPDRFHGIVYIRSSNSDVGAHGRAPLHENRRFYCPSRSMGSLIAGFKSAVTQKINTKRHTPGAPVWKRNYHDRILRNECELNRFREYIQTNPAQWENDEYFN